MSNAESPKPKTEPAEAPKMPIDVNPELSGSLVTSAKADKSTEGGTTDQLQQYWYQFLSILSKLPDYWGEFYGEYQRPIIIVALILATAVTIKVTLAAIDAINDIPLLAPLFELIGIGYSGWFLWRYRLASTRRELIDEIKNLTEDIVGKNQPK